MRDVVKNQYITPKNQPHRRRRRKRNLSLYYLMIFILILIVGVILSFTVLFKITEIKVTGDTQYDTKIIIDSSKIKIGGNLFRTDFESARKKILEELIYIDSVEIKKTLPSGVNIEVEPSIPYAYIQYLEGYLLISQSGKILSSSAAAEQENILIFNGYEPIEAEIGSYIKCDDDEKDKLIKKLCDEIKNTELTGVTLIDISDRYDVTVYYGSRIIIKLGSANDLNYKLNFAKELIENKIGKNKEGTIFMTGENGFGFVEKKDLDQYRQNYQSATVTQQTAVSSGSNTVSSVQTTTLSSSQQ